MPRKTKRRGKKTVEQKSYTRLVSRLRWFSLVGMSEASRETGIDFGLRGSIARMTKGVIVECSYLLLESRRRASQFALEKPHSTSKPAARPSISS